MKVKHRFYIPGPWPKNEGETLIVPTEAFHHMKVLRLQRGSKIEIFDGNGGSAFAILERMDKKRAEITLTTLYTSKQPPKFRITLGYCIGKADKTDTTVRMATELGVWEICPIQSRYSVIRLNKEKAESKRNHWQKIAQEASRQSGRVFVPHVRPVVELIEFLKESSAKSEDSLKIILHPVADMKLSDIINESKGQPKQAVVLIGPEGGFAPNEIEEALQNGFRSVSLGSRILRTETAPAAVLSVLQYVFGDFGR